LRRLAHRGHELAVAVDEQGAATEEISRNVLQAATGTLKVAGNMSEVNEGAAKTGAASGEAYVV